MKIGMMAPWNVADGAALHAELVGREWVKMGHELTVLAPIEERPILGQDEPFVVRCYRVDTSPLKGLRPLFLDRHPFLARGYDLFVVHSLTIMPMAELLKLWPQIKARARTMLVFHESGLPPYPDFYRFQWDALICYHQRYLETFAKKFPRETMRYVPYPCHPPSPGDKAAARSRLGLPLDKKVVLSFGFAVHQHLVALPVLEGLSHGHPLLYLVIASEGGSQLLGEAAARYSFLECREERPPNDRLYTYLHAADALLIHKAAYPLDIVVSSTAFLCLGSGCPIIMLDAGYADTFGEEVLKYRDFLELEEALIRVFEGYRPPADKLESFFASHAPTRVASALLDVVAPL